MEEFLNTAVEVVVLSAFIAGGFTSYYLSVLYRESREYVRSRAAKEFFFALFSQFIFVFSRSLPEQCRIPQRKLWMAGGIWFGLLGAAVLLLWIMWSFGFAPNKG